MSTWSPTHLNEAKILVVRNDGLGDFVLTLPLVAALKQQLPGARIYALVNQHLQGLLPLLPDLEGMIAAGEFDTVLNYAALDVVLECNLWLRLTGQHPELK